MGLDMYLDKAKRINGATIDDIRRIEDYYDWERRPEKYKNCSMKEWCGKDIDGVSPNLINAYRDEYKERYYYWDVERRTPRSSIFSHVGYWRKANQIHNWFVENVQNGIDDCGSYEVTEEQITELLDTCKRVKKNSILVTGKVKNGMRSTENGWEYVLEDGEYIEDPSIAMDLLPTTAGFFFGSTGYDQWYMEDIDETIKILTEVLSNTDFETEVVVYTASW